MIVVSRRTGRPVGELTSKRRARRVNPREFEVLTAHQWLARYNRLVRAAGGREPSARAFVDAVGS
jgi:hypothetical protein